MIAPSNARRERAHILPELARPQGDEGLLEWDEVEQRLASASIYWVCTVHPKSTPHARPLWGVYLDGALYFDGFFKSGWFRNLAANPALSVHLENGSDAVILEGHAGVIEEMALARRVAAAYGQKYAPHTLEAEPGGYRLAPRVVFAWLNGDVQRTATRWRFDGA